MCGVMAVGGQPVNLQVNHKSECLKRLLTEYFGAAENTVHATLSAGLFPKLVIQSICTRLLWEVTQNILGCLKMSA